MLIRYRVCHLQTILIVVNFWLYITAFNIYADCYFSFFHDCLRDVLHKYANEDVSLGSWFIGLDVDQVDDRRLCCGTPPGNFENFPVLVPPWFYNLYEFLWS